ncbi:MAG TPA: FAD-binding protein [Burkholderiales bacterium]
MNAMPLSAAELCDAMRHGRAFDPARLNRILAIDTQRGLIEVQAATPWAAIAAALRPGDALAASAASAALPGVDDSLACNAPGPDGAPAVTHVQALTLVSPDGELRRLSRHREPELFSLVVGGFGLFGALYSVTLSMESLSRTVEKAAPPQRIVLGPGAPGARPLELLLPPERLERFVADSDATARAWRLPLHCAEVRRTAPEEDSFLRWASRDFAQLKLHFAGAEGLGARVRLAQLRRELIDAAIVAGGRFHIASTREATRAQLEACYPQLPAFLDHKRRFDPRERLTNPWYVHQRGLLLGERCEVRWGG